VTSLWRVAVRAHGDDVEASRARLLERAPQGFEEVDLGGGVVELAAYAGPEQVDELVSAIPRSTVLPVEEGWEDAWRAFHRPTVVGGLWLGPPWEQPPDPSCAVVIDPGRAFGTGSHPTTRLCVQLLASTSIRGSLLDVGCGSGVLAIAAVRLGFANVVAVDVDPVAVETTRANAAANGVRVHASVLDAERDDLPTANVVVANVLLRPVEHILARLTASEAITSGYLDGERPSHAGWEHVETVELNGWAADRFRRGGAP
jgi:ribosomal protein L11 methyltransferase